MSSNISATDEYLADRAIRTIRSCVTIGQLKTAYRYAWHILERIYHKPGDDKIWSITVNIINSERDKKVDQLT